MRLRGGGEERRQVAGAGAVSECPTRRHARHAPVQRAGKGVKVDEARVVELLRGGT